MTGEQQWLPFDFVTTEKQQLREEAEKKEREIKEMVNALPYFPNPKNDHQKLFNLQYEYKHGRAEALGEMYVLCVEVCFKIINHIAKRTPRVKKISYVDKELKAYNAASYFIEQYIKRPDFMRHNSILSYLFKRVSHELFYVRKVDEIVEFVDLTLFFKEDEEYGTPEDWGE